MYLLSPPAKNYPPAKNDGTEDVNMFEESRDCAVRRLSMGRVRENRMYVKAKYNGF